VGLEDGDLQRLESKVSKGKSLSFRYGMRRRVVLKSVELIFISLYRISKKNLSSWHNYIAHDYMPEVTMIRETKI
jgi:hypothetical protein